MSPALNGRGGYDLSDADVAEVMAASFGGSGVTAARDVRRGSARWLLRVRTARLLRALPPDVVARVAAECDVVLTDTPTPASRSTRPRQERP